MKIQWVNIGKNIDLELFPIVAKTRVLIWSWGMADACLMWCHCWRLELRRSWSPLPVSLLIESVGRILSSRALLILLRPSRIWVLIKTQAEVRYLASSSRSLGGDGACQGDRSKGLSAYLGPLWEVACWGCFVTVHESWSLVFLPKSTSNEVTLLVWNQP